MRFVPGNDGRTHRFVSGEGPVPCDLMCIGERPGREEDARGRPFIGKSGMELDRYLLRKVGRHRSTVYVTNLVKYRGVGKNGEDTDPTDEDIQRDQPILLEEIQDVQPKVIATIGGWSTRWLLGDGFDMDWCNGLAFAAGALHGNVVVVPIVHPAAGLHNPMFAALTAYGFDRLGQVMRGKTAMIIAPADDIKYPEYGENRGLLIEPKQNVAVDTEGSVSRPWGLSWSSAHGTGSVWRMHKSGPAPFTRGAEIPESVSIVLHHGLHDIPVLRSMGWDLDGNRIDDTMIMAYNLCVEPQGLKALARRHCGMRMKDYADLMDGPNKKAAFDYMVRVIEWLNKQSRSE